MGVVYVVRVCVCWCVDVDVVGTSRKERPLLEDYGAVSRSGKMLIMEQILKLWKMQKHKILLFAQTRQVRWGGVRRVGGEREW